MSREDSNLGDDSSSIGAKDEDDEDDDDDGMDEGVGSGDPERLKAFNVSIESLKTNCSIQSKYYS